MNHPTQPHSRRLFEGRRGHAPGRLGLASARPATTATRLPAVQAKAGSLQATKGSERDESAGGSPSLPQPCSLFSAPELGASNGMLHALWSWRLGTERPRHPLVVGPGSRVMCFEPGESQASGNRPGSPSFRLGRKAKARAGARGGVLGTDPGTNISGLPTAAGAPRAWARCGISRDRLSPAL